MNQLTSRPTGRSVASHDRGQDKKKAVRETREPAPPDRVSHTATIPPTRLPPHCRYSVFRTIDPTCDEGLPLFSFWNFCSSKSPPSPRTRSSIPPTGPRDARSAPPGLPVQDEPPP